MSNWSGLEEKTPTSPVDLYRANIQKLEDIFVYRLDLESTFKGGLETVELAYRIARSHMDVVNNNGQPKVLSHEFNTINKTVDIFIDFYISNNELALIFKDLSYNLSILLNNWNENIAKNPELRRKLRTLDRFARDCKTVEDSTYILRTLLHKLKRYAETEPMTINLSKHYLDSLQDAKNSECKEESKSECQEK